MTHAPAGRPTARWTEVFAVVLLAVATHAPALHDTSYTIDDHRIVELNVRLIIERPADLVRLVTTSYWAEDYEHERLWRPVVLASFALDRAVFGPDPDAFRAVNVSLHAATSVLLLLLLTRVLAAPRPALAAALLFAAHPIHAEATAGIVGRAEVLGLGFVLLGMHLHLARLDAAEAVDRGVLARLLGAAPAALAFTLGFGSKEVALTGPFILTVVEFGALAPRTAQELRRRAPSYAMYLAAIAAYLVARWWVLGDLVPPPEAQSIGVLGLHTRVLVAADVSLRGLLVTLAPPPTASVYPFEPPSWSDPIEVLKVAAAIALVLLATVAMLRGRTRRARACGVGLLGYFMSLGPSSNLIPIGVVFAERLLYTPSAWAFLAIAGLARPLLRRPRASTFALAIVLPLLALRLGANARAWSDELRLWRGTVQRFPALSLGHYGLAQALEARGDAEGAMKHVLLTLEHEPPGSRRAAAGRVVLARLLHAKGQTHGAIAALQEALAMQPANTQVRIELLRIQLDLLAASPPSDDRSATLAALDALSLEALRLAPHDYRLWIYRGTLLSWFDGREDEAEAAYGRAIARRSIAWEAHFNRARLRYARGDLEGAFDDYRQVSAMREAARGADAQQVLPYAVFWEARLASELDRPAEGQAARAWLARHRPDLLERLP